MLRRIVLFVITNIFVIVTIGIIFSLLGIGSYVTESGMLDLKALLIFSAIIGFGGSFFSLAISRKMAKWIMRVRILDPNGRLSPEERELVDKVHQLARKAGLRKMPQVGIYPSAEVNAFATGPSKKRSLVAVSNGLLNEMDDEAVEGVLAHEIAHVANGDMVTMTLLQGVVNTFVVFLSRVIAWVASRFVNENLQVFVHIAAIIFFEIFLSILGSLVVFAYSRHREYRADGGGAAYVGKDKMIHALQSLKAYKNRIDNRQQSLATLKINGKGGWLRLFSSHPDLDSRIRRLS